MKWTSHLAQGWTKIPGAQHIERISMLLHLMGYQKALVIEI